MNSAVIWDVVTRSPVEVHGCSGGTYRLCVALRLHLAISSALKMEAVHSSEMLLDFIRLHGVTPQNIVKR
jgi:hypothetical protein